MILHPGVLALLGGSAVALALLVAASVVGIEVLRRWDFSSSSARQLALERRTFLVSSLASVALVIEIASSLLFLYTVDDLHRLFVGAMCATGSLNANPVGWWVLPAKLLILLAAPVWIALNNLDHRAGEIPLLLAWAGSALYPPLLAAWGVRTRDRALIALGIVAAALSLATIRFYAQIAPLWMVLAATGAALAGASLLLERWLRSGTSGERAGFTAAPLYDESRRERLLPVAAALVSAPEARARSKRPR